jgi:hypothetical protein
MDRLLLRLQHAIDSRSDGGDALDSRGDGGSSGVNFSGGSGVDDVGITGSSDCYNGVGSAFALESLTGNMMNTRVRALGERHDFDST